MVVYSIKLDGHLIQAIFDKIDALFIQFIQDLIVDRYAFCASNCCRNNLSYKVRKFMTTSHPSLVWLKKWCLNLIKDNQSKITFNLEYYSYQISINSYHLCLNIIFIFSIFRSTANAIQNYSFEAKTDDLPSLADKMSLLDIGPNVTKIPIERNNGSSGLVTKIPIERVDKGKYFTAQLFYASFFHSEWFWGSNYQFRIFLFHNFLVLYFESDNPKIIYAKKNISIKNEQKGIGIPLIT